MPGADGSGAPTAGWVDEAHVPVFDGFPPIPFELHAPLDEICAGGVDVSIRVALNGVKGDVLAYSAQLTCLPPFPALGRQALAHAVRELGISWLAWLPLSDAHACRGLCLEGRDE